MPGPNPQDIEVSPKVVALISSSGEDFRVSTTCLGPALHPVRLKPPKETDIVIPVGEHRLYVSAVKARWLRCVDGNVPVLDDLDDGCGWG